MTNNDMLKDVCAALGLRRAAIQELLAEHGFTASNSLVDGWFLGETNPNFKPLLNWPLSLILKHISNAWLLQQGAEAMMPELEKELHAVGRVLARKKQPRTDDAEALLRTQLEARPGQPPDAR